MAHRYVGINICSEQMYSVDIILLSVFVSGVDNKNIVIHLNRSPDQFSVKALLNVSLVSI